MPLSASEPLCLRAPTLADGASVAEVIRNIGTLEPNSTYAYLLLCHHFSRTSLLLERAGSLLGCALGYRLPKAPGTLFIWQIGVLPELRGQGLGAQLLDTLIARQTKLEFVEATISPSNQASLRLFRNRARALGVEFHSVPQFEACHFGASKHEEERLVRLGPFSQAFTRGQVRRLIREGSYT